VSSYTRVNLLFGAFTMRHGRANPRLHPAVHPRVQRQATEFIMDRPIRRCSGISRAIVREILHEPLPHLFAFAT
jgi:hypothetical protein